ncbi:decarboxylase [Candidatus Woesearchaeota archaeon]|jgi:ornithine decarboxylase|nr:decarboxylase [Candidatus Woesearchaeota archaeon]
MKPEFILSKSVVLKQYNKVKEHCSIVSYSSKTNPLVTSVLEENNDCWFSIHLKNELKNVKDKSRVLFLAQAWTVQEVASLVSLGINKFAVDNEQDLETLLVYLGKSDVMITLFLRLKLKEHTLRTEKYFVFGMSSSTINEKVRTLIDHPNISALGVHFHRKTQNMAEWNYQYEISSALDNDVLEKIKFMNIGGGLPSEYANTNVKVVSGIFNKIDLLKEWLLEKKINLIIEPGRFIAAPAVKLVTTIVGKHSNNLIVNASVYNTDMDALIVPVKLLVEGELNKEGKPFVIKGITPCSMDLFRYRVYLDNPQVGDSLVFLNAGAYNFTTEFCDLDKIETEIVE